MRKIHQVDEESEERKGKMKTLFETLREETDSERWASYKIGDPKKGGTIVYGPLDKAIKIAKRDNLPQIVDLTHGDKVVWRASDEEE